MTNKTDPPTNVGSNAGLGPMLAMRVMSAVWLLVRRGPNFDGGQREVEAAILAALDEAVAAERERWETAVSAYLTACDESWAEVCELAAKQGVKSVQIGPKQAAGITALAALREFCGPNGGINRHCPVRSNDDN